MLLVLNEGPAALPPDVQKGLEGVKKSASPAILRVCDFFDREAFRIRSSS